ncbi:hypothetical protein, partial [Pseudoalteromonas sp. McH1-42]|uniref:hypothetical protein n=1 Tax=Pseudoalteromonas sp. McH1-42 TaxID=2917752 RepID=UPI001EF47EFC
KFYLTPNSLARCFSALCPVSVDAHYREIETQRKRFLALFWINFLPQKTAQTPHKLPTKTCG